MVRHQNPLQVIGQQLNHAATDFAGAVSGWLHSLVPGHFRAEQLL